MRIVDGRRYAFIATTWAWCESSPIVRKWWRRRPESQIDDPTVPLTELKHSFVYEENSAGARYGYCRRCGRYEDEVRANEFHGPIPCEPRLLLLM